MFVLSYNNMTKYSTLVLTLLLFRLYGYTYYDGFYMLLWIFHALKIGNFQRW